MACRNSYLKFCKETCYILLLGHIKQVNEFEYFSERILSLSDGSKYQNTSWKKIMSHPEVLLKKKEWKCTHVWWNFFMQNRASGWCPPFLTLSGFHTHRHTQTHTDTHRHTQTHTDTHTYTIILMLLLPRNVYSLRLMKQVNCPIVKCPVRILPHDRPQKCDFEC